MLSPTRWLNIILAAAALCAAPQAGAMRCEPVFAGGPPPQNPSKFACLGDPAVGTPVSFWRKKDMGSPGRTKPIGCRMPGSSANTTT